jgi:hypothetical protein
MHKVGISPEAEKVKLSGSQSFANPAPEGIRDNAAQTTLLKQFAEIGLRQIIMFLHGKLS